MKYLIHLLFITSHAPTSDSLAQLLRSAPSQLMTHNDILLCALATTRSELQLSNSSLLIASSVTELESSYSFSNLQPPLA